MRRAGVGGSVVARDEGRRASVRRFGWAVVLVALLALGGVIGLGGVAGAQLGGSPGQLFLVTSFSDRHGGELVEIRDVAGKRVRIVDRVRRLFGALDGTAPRFAPDGSMIAWNSDRGLTVERAAGGDRRVVVAAERCVSGLCPLEMTFAWSRDSKRLLVGGVGPQSDGLVIVRVDTASARLAAPSMLGVVFDVNGFSPDGRRILYTRRVVNRLERCCTSGFVLADSDGRRPHVLHKYPNTLHGHTHPSWSPDSRSIALVSDGSDPSLPDCSIIEVSTGRLRRLQRCEAGSVPAVWSPDSARIAIARSVPLRIYGVRNQTRYSLDRAADSAVWRRSGELTLVVTADVAPYITSVYTNRNGAGTSRLLFRFPADQSVIAVDPR